MFHKDFAIAQFSRLTCEPSSEIYIFYRLAKLEPFADIDLYNL